MVQEEHKKLYYNEIYPKEREGKYLEIEPALHDLLKIYSSNVIETDERLFRAELLLTSSIIALYKKRYSQARTDAIEASNIFEQCKSWNRLPYALNRVAETYRFDGDYQSALEYTGKAIDALKKAYSENSLELKKVLPPFERELADALIKLECFSEAERVLCDAYRMAEETGDDFTKGHLALTLFSLYIRTKELEKAERYLKIGENVLVTQAGAQKNIPTEIIVMRDWAKFYLKKGESEKSKNILNQAITIAKKYGFDYLTGDLENK